MGLIVRNINFTGNFRGTFPQVPPPPPAPPAPSDQYGAYTVLDLPGTGTNNTNNNVFLDSSANNFAITRYGNTTQGSFSPFSTAPGYWSNYFDGSGDTLTAPPGSAFAYGTGDFTIEAWVYPTAMNPSNALIFSQSVSGTNYFILVLRANGTIEFTGTSSGGGSPILGSSAVNLNTWSHIAVVRNSGVVTVFVNGVGGTGISNTTDFTNTTYVPTIGAYTHAETNNYTGYISNLRIVKGTALYTTNFTPSTTPLTAVSGTSLLTCQSNRCIDNSSNAFAITRVGDTSVSAFGPFAPSSSYNAATMGGSIYFDGSNDYLSIPANSAFAFGTGDFTVEAWVYTVGGARLLTNRRTQGAEAGSWSFSVTPTGISFSEVIDGEPGASSGASLGNRWAHVAATRSGSVLRIFVDGVVVATNASFSNNLYSTAFPLIVGSSINENYFGGYASNIRIVKGSAVYTANFTPPTAPVTAISGTSLLLNGTNAGIIDSAVQNNLETIGDAKISTAISANGSMYFDGNLDFVMRAISSKTDPMYIQGNTYTVECWVYPINTSIGIIYSVSAFNTNYFGIWELIIDGTTVTIAYRVNTGVQFPATYLSFTAQSSFVGSWAHIAISVSNGSMKCFLNGSQIGATQNISAVNFTPVAAGLGGRTNGYTPADNFTGYINDFRITQNKARYTTNFTPPTRS